MEIKTFSEIVGQNYAVNFLKKVIQKKRLSHAYLFYGPKGVGKETSAYALISGLFCKNPKNGEACKSCISCKKIIKNIHPDLKIIFPEKKEILISQIRSIMEFIKYRPIEAPYQIILISPAEKMNKQAANALLKSLEEPPPYTVFILISENQSQLLPTITSRCQFVRFNPIPSEIIEEYLKNYYQFEPEVAKTISQISQGSIGMAINIAQKGLLEEVNAFIKACFSENWQTKFKIVERIAKLTTEDQDLFFFLLTMWIWKSYKQKILHKDVSLPACSDEFSLEKPYVIISQILKIKNNLQFYLSSELSFLHILLFLEKHLQKTK